MGCISHGRRLLTCVLAGLFAVVGCLMANGLCFAEPALLSNEYVSVCVNSSEDGQGRYSLSTTGGDPGIAGDDNKALIYGGMDPRTSFTTLRIDGKNYVFGGPTAKRAGKTGLYGNIVEAPRVRNNGIEMTVDINGLLVTQSLSLVKSTTTGREDTLRILYTVKNETPARHNVGLRMVLDTMLGANDGAPFRLPDTAITKSLVLSGPKVPAFWQTFDSLKTPVVRAQGTLRGSGFTVPNSVYFTDWGTLADALWDVKIEPGKGFVRKGEFELDSATALYWDPKDLEPGASREYATYYGLGGITVSSGTVFLGVTSPSEVALGKTGMEVIPIVAYLENATGTNISDLKVSIKLPKGLVTGEPLVKEIRSLPAKGETQIGWNVKVMTAQSGDTAYDVVVSSGAKTINKVRRSLYVQAAPRLSLKIDDGNGKQQSENLVRVVGTVQNLGTTRADRVRLLIKPPEGMQPVRNEQVVRELAFLDPGVAVKVTWLFYRTADTGKPFTVEAAASNAVGQTVSKVIKPK